ncbi:MAG TPA: hypothetical protein VHA37_05830 [Candidatus Saccharimonadales bacterium]|nr:hypothetical protein [Candidatus Saccharimonadales bacterium]
MSGSAEFTDVMKVGGAVLGVEDAKGRLLGQNDETFAIVGEEVSEDPGDIVLVSSFAIGRGMLETGVKERPNSVSELQRLATIGQPLLHATWAEHIPKKTTGQVLLTQQELGPQTGNQPRILEILRTIGVLLAHDDVPTINENDAISHEEITFGSNDVLSATLAANMQLSKRFGQVRLFLLTDVNGVYKNLKDPTTRMPIIDSVNSQQGVAQGAPSRLRIGGMESKFQAARIARYAGVPTYVYNPADGHREAAVEGEIGTYFPVWTPHNP